MEIVSVLRIALADKVGKERYELWFGASTRLELDEGTLTVRAPSPFFQDWLRSNFRQEIETVCLDTLGACPTLRFCVDSAPAESSSMKPRAESDPAVKRCAKSELGMVRHAIPETDAGSEPAVAPLRRRFCELESFACGASNRLAYAAAQMVAERLGELSPLVIHGPTGVGKTHLLQGIVGAVRKARPGVNALYISAEQFTSGFLQALRGSGLPSFRQKYRGVELLVIDDLHFFCGKRYTQMELLYTIDTLCARDGRRYSPPTERRRSWWNWVPS